MSKEITLLSLAMLKVSIDSGKDYLEYLRPFVMQSLASKTTVPIADESIAMQLQDDFGLVIPRRTVQILLQRISKAGFLKKEHGIYTISKEIPTDNNQLNKADASRKISAVINSLITFTKSSTGRDINENDALDALLLFLSKFSISCLKSFLRGTALPNRINSDNWKLVLVSTFVSKLEKSEPERFENFILLVEGHMLANALLCPDLQSVSMVYKKVTLYFDTPLLLQYLGLEGDAKKQAIDELIMLVNNLEGTIACFSHTLDELVNVIRNSSEYIDSPKGRGSIVYESRKAQRTKSDLLLLAEKAESHLEDGNIVIKSTPVYKSIFQIDETKFADFLEDEVNYYNPKAKDHDINSVRSIYVLRSGAYPHSIEDSNAILVTSNSAFAKAAYEYGKNIEQSREVSTVITDFSLANTAWLKAPSGASLLPQKEVMAFAYATLRPNHDFLKRVLVEADRLAHQGKITARDHQLLRSSQHVQSELMTLTLGEDDSLTESSITYALNRVTAEIKKEETEHFADEQAAHKETKESLLLEREKNKRVREQLYWRCEKSANRIASGISIFISILIIIGIAKGIGYQASNPILGWLMTIGSIVLPLLTWAGLSFGTNTKNINGWLRDRLKNWLFQKEAKKLGVDTKL